MNQCPKCGSPLKVVPAGISKKTNKPYRAFTACTKWECDYTDKIAPDAPQGSRNGFSGTGGQRYQIEPQFNPEAKFNELAQELNNLKYAMHALWAVLIQGDKEKEKSYELHKIPLVARSKPEPEPEDEAKFEEPLL